MIPFMFKFICMRNIVILLCAMFGMPYMASAEIQYFSFREGVTSAQTFSANRSVTETMSYIDVTYQFQGAQMSHTIDGDLFIMADARKTVVAGEPSLPYYSDLFLVPSLENVSVEEIDATYYEFNGVDVAPSPGLNISGVTESNVSVTKGDIYQKNALFPTKTERISNIQNFRGAPLVTVNIFPIRFNPVTQSVRCYTSITYRIHLDESERPYIKESTLDMVESMIANPNSVSRYKAPSPQYKPGGTTASYSGAEKYLMITVPEFFDVTKKFAAWKTMMGYDCTVLSEAEWTPEMVSKAVLQYHQASNIKYLLLVGDFNHIPVQYVDIYHPKRDELISIATDKLYGCFDGGYIPSFSIGRISGNSSSEIDGIFDKIKKYEATPPVSSDYYNHALHLAYFQDSSKDDGSIDGIAADGYDFVKTSESIKAQCEKAGKIVSRVYTSQYPDLLPQKYSKDEPLPEELMRSDIWSGTTEQISEKINEGQVYVMYDAHGEVYYWESPSFGITDADSLQNGEVPTVVFSAACFVGKFDGNYCLAEAFLKNPNGGAVAMTANTHYGWCSYNDIYLDYLIRYNVLSNKDASIADNMERALLYLSDGEDADYPYTKHMHLTTHYFGDPSMRMYANEPGCLSPSIRQEGNTVYVAVDVLQSKVTLTSTENPLDMSKFKSYTAYNDTIKFEHVDFPYTICVTKKGYVPYVLPSDRYIQNLVFVEDTSIVSGFNIYAGKAVSLSTKGGDVVCKAGHTQLQSNHSIVLSDGFRVEDGASFKALLMEHGSCNYKIYPQSNAVNEDDFYSPGYTIPNNPVTTDLMDEEQSVISLYPNPTDGHFIVDFGGNVGEKHLSIYTASGELVETGVFSGETADFNFSGWMKGIYVIRIVSDNEVFTERMILK